MEILGFWMIDLTWNTDLESGQYLTWNTRKTLYLTTPSPLTHIITDSFYT